MTRCSALPRIMACPASSQAPDIAISGDSEPARLGRAVHEAMTLVVNEGLRAPPDLTKIAENHGVEDLDELAMLVWFGVRTWQRISRETKVLAIEQYLDSLGDQLTLIGTPDIVCEADDGSLIVVDWKSGYVERDYRNQIKGYLWLVSRKAEHDIFKGCIVWLRTCEVETFAMTRIQLNEWRDELLKALDNDAYSPGAHCEFCPLSHECAAKSALVRSTASELVSLEIGKSVLSPKQIGELYPHKILLKRALDAYDEILKMTIREHGPQPTGDGRILDLTKRDRDYFYLDRIAKPLGKAFDCSCMEELIETLGPDAITVTKKIVQEVAGCQAPKGGIGKAKAAIIQSLRDANAVVSRTGLVLTVKKEK